MRHKTAAQKLEEWQAEAKERELEKVAQRHLKELAKKQQLEQRQQVGGGKPPAHPIPLCSRTEGPGQQPPGSGLCARPGWRQPVGAFSCLPLKAPGWYRQGGTCALLRAVEQLPW